MREIILVGGGGHCKSVIDVIEQEGKFEIAGVIDNNLNLGDKVLNYEIIGCDDDLKNLRKKYEFAIVTVGQIKSPNIRIKLFNLLKELKFKLPIIISPRSYVSKYTEIGEGTVIMHDALINAGAKIGKNCIINTKALIEHDSIVEDNCHISTGAIVNGNCLIKKNTFIGSNSLVVNNLTVETGFYKAGSLIK
ncbi:NeuD/PglB/VioB family sugar acetyltransferase [Caminibacter mediatlanticus]|uniref:Acetyl transferase n=1 Tax=Caminibacter mediatlanticus TB-2 TaxID=391592 RepID=A0AAI9F1X4_9BACT|nr:NeuD/PglB/VioB family sugar acetyltransferase [Caminibacter mediatlanticus]EDM23165.1 acetyl transferase [Caminibacter mediatlanticus TB-2]